MAAQLAVRLNEAERRELALRSELIPDAYRLYIDGRYEWGKRTPEGFEKAAEFFHEAIDRDPSYARAYAGLADGYLLRGAFGSYRQLEMPPEPRRRPRARSSWSPA